MKHFIAIALMTAVVALTGCTEDPTSPASNNNVSFSIRSEVAPTGNSPSNVAEIQSAKILLKNLKFHRFPSNDSSDIKVGPFAVHLDLTGSTTTIAATRVPAGQYDRIRFRLHKPEDSEPIPDPEFRDGESGQLRYSVIVRGNFNGTPFVYKSRENASQEHRLPSPISVTSDGTVNVTLVVNPHVWFVENGQPLDPTDPRNAQVIDDAIKASFSRVFRDDNFDGRAD